MIDDDDDDVRHLFGAVLLSLPTNSESIYHELQSLQNWVERSKGQ